jgi:hypothetical protein
MAYDMEIISVTRKETESWGLNFHARFLYRYIFSYPRTSFQIRWEEFLYFNETKRRSLLSVQSAAVRYVLSNTGMENYRGVLRHRRSSHCSHYETRGREFVPTAFVPRALEFSIKRKHNKKPYQLPAEPRLTFVESLFLSLSAVYFLEAYPKRAVDIIYCTFRPTQHCTLVFCVLLEIIKKSYLQLIKTKLLTRNFLTLVVLILWHDVRKPEFWNQRRYPQLGNCSVNTFPRQRICKQHSNNCHCYATTL